MPCEFDRYRVIQNFISATDTKLRAALEGDDEVDQQLLDLMSSKLLECVRFSTLTPDQMAVVEKENGEFIRRHVRSVDLDTARKVNEGLLKVGIKGRKAGTETTPWFRFGFEIHGFKGLLRCVSLSPSLSLSPFLSLSLSLSLSCLRLAFSRSLARSLLFALN